MPMGQALEEWLVLQEIVDEIGVESSVEHVA